MTKRPSLALGRSMLFVPGNRPERFDKAARSGADAVILDLEDAVPEAEKSGALMSVTRWLSSQPQQDQLQYWVRVPDARRPSDQLLALSKCTGFSGFVLPKVETPEDTAGWSAPLIAQIESAIGILAMPAIAQTDQPLLALAIGPEDLAVSLGTEPGLESLQLSCSLAVIAARAAGRQVIACPGSIGEFRDLDAWRATLAAGRRLGSDGMMCIHPAQVSVTNEVFSPSMQAIEQALKIVAAAQAGRAKGQGAVSVDGRMIDPPVVARAENLLAAADRFGLISQKQL